MIRNRKSDWPFGLLSEHHYGAIALDPPWQFRGYVKAGVPQRAAKQHYPTMSFDELAALPVSRLAKNDAAMFMWGIGSHMPQALALADHWGFTFSSKAFCWAKTRKTANDNLWDFVDDRKFPKIQDDLFWHMGLGHTTRKNSEDCWLFRKGNPKRVSKGVRELIVAPLREHSRKPDEFFDRAEALYAGPYCELFSREPRKGWSSWGNQMETFNENV